MSSSHATSLSTYPQTILAWQDTEAQFAANNYYGDSRKLIREEGFEKAKRSSGWNFLTWMGTIGRTPYAAPLWPKEYGGLSGEAWIVSRCAYPGCQQGRAGGRRLEMRPNHSDE